MSKSLKDRIAVIGMGCNVSANAGIDRPKIS